MGVLVGVENEVNANSRPNRVRVRIGAYTSVLLVTTGLTFVIIKRKQAELGVPHSEIQVELN